MAIYILPDCGIVEESTDAIHLLPGIGILNQTQSSNVKDLIESNLVNNGILINGSIIQ